MLKTFILISCLISSLLLPAQQSADTVKIPSFYLGLSSGINNKAGVVGLNIDYALDNQTLVGLSLGSVRWGFKTALALQAHPKQFKKFFYGVGFSLSTGQMGFTKNLELSSGQRADVILDLKPITTLNFVIGNSWPLGKNNRFFIEAGYAFRLTEKTSMYALKDQNLLLDPSAKKALILSAPGGVILSGGLAFTRK